jgi:hypothetical protein
MEEATLNPKFAVLIRGIVLAIGHEGVTVVAGIHHPNLGQLLLVIDALNAAGGGFSPGQARQEERGQNRDDGYDYEQLDESETRTLWRRHAHINSPDFVCF